jgi:hypothetical protein
MTVEVRDCSLLARASCVGSAEVYPFGQSGECPFSAPQPGHTWLAQQAGSPPSGSLLGGPFVAGPALDRSAEVLRSPLLREHPGRSRQGGWCRTC